MDRELWLSRTSSPGSRSHLRQKLAVEIHVCNNVDSLLSRVSHHEIDTMYLRTTTLCAAWTFKLFTTFTAKSSHSRMKRRKMKACKERWLAKWKCDWMGPVKIDRWVGPQLFWAELKQLHTSGPGRQCHHLQHDHQEDVCYREKYVECKHNAVSGVFGSKSCKVNKKKPLPHGL